jgi:hypothetical protein
MPPSWTTPIDNYCERIGQGFWAEPLNAVTNAAFLAAAALALLEWRKAGGKDHASLWLIAVTAVVGTGSFLFHTFANRWSVLADVIPIAVFIYSYFLLAMRRYLGLARLAAVAATAVFMLVNMSFVRLWLGVFPGVTLNGSVGYVPAALALLGVGGLCLRLSAHQAGIALLWAAGIFAVSLVLRTVDGVVCTAVPVGTHFLWHVLNAVVLLILMCAAIASSAVDRAQARG